MSEFAIIKTIDLGPNLLLLHVAHGVISELRFEVLKVTRSPSVHFVCMRGKKEFELSIMIYFLFPYSFYKDYGTFEN